ncbi:MAG: hypothetical protein IPM16_12925 [Chloroflexi bacterium]|nr:hypothetical protein [Chloroflexota bacterium]
MDGIHVDSQFALDGKQIGSSVEMILGAGTCHIRYSYTQSDSANRTGTQQHD